MNGVILIGVLLNCEIFNIFIELLLDLNSLEFNK